MRRISFDRTACYSGEYGSDAGMADRMRDICVFLVYRDIRGGTDREVRAKGSGTTGELPSSGKWAAAPAFRGTGVFTLFRKLRFLESKTLRGIALRRNGTVS